MLNSQTISTQSRHALRRALDICQGQERLAELCREHAKKRQLQITITQKSIWQYLHVAKFGVAPQVVLLIESATNGKVTRSQLRPDLYPPDQYEYQKGKRKKQKD